MTVLDYSGNVADIAKISVGQKRVPEPIHDPLSNLNTFLGEVTDASYNKIIATRVVMSGYSQTDTSGNNIADASGNTIEPAASDTLAVAVGKCWHETGKKGDTSYNTATYMPIAPTELTITGTYVSGGKAYKLGRLVTVNMNIYKSTGGFTDDTTYATITGVKPIAAGYIPVRPLGTADSSGYMNFSASGDDTIVKYRGTSGVGTNLIVNFTFVAEA